MEIDEAIKRVESLIAAYEQELANISEEVALNAKALVVHRIQTKGIGKTYSTNKIPAYLLLIDETNLDTAQTIAYVKSVADAPEAEDRELTWSDVRQAHGNQVAFIDLTFTGRMLNNLGVIKTEKVGEAYVTTIGGFEEEVRKKLFWNAQRFGDFLLMNDEERKIIAEFTAKRIRELEHKFLEK